MACKKSSAGGAAGKNKIAAAKPGKASKGAAAKFGFGSPVKGTPIQQNPVVQPKKKK